MSEWHHIHTDPFTKRMTWWRDLGEGKIEVRTDYHVDEILAQNHDARMDAMGTRHGEWSRVASVPLNLHFQELAEAQSQMDRGYIDKWLTENSAFKTR